MILTKEVEITIRSQSLEHYINLGYNVKIAEKIKIPVEHLQEKCSKLVKVKCDVETCGKEKLLPYYKYTKNTRNFTIYYACSQICANTKREAVFMEKYNVKNPFLSKEISDKIKHTRQELYGDENYTNREQAKKTMLERHGVEWYFNSDEFKKQFKQTNLKNLGVEFPFQSEEIQKKGEETKLKKYGDKNYNNLKKCKQTKKERHGDENYNNLKKQKETLNKQYDVEFTWHIPGIIEKGEETRLKKYGDKNYNNPNKISKTHINKSKEEKEISDIKRIKTNLQRYGTKYPSQNSIVLDKIHKNSYKLKDYIFPSGKIVKTQGYENLALDILLKTYKESNILTDNKDIEKKIGQIWYLDNNGKKHRYYPDIYIISENRIIEVKSDWTYKCKKDNIFLKQQACLNDGLNFEFMIFNRKYELLSEDEVKSLII